MIALTPQLICAASLDAGNASMLRAGRSAWNADDLDAAALQSDALWNCAENMDLPIEPAPLQLAHKVDVLDGVWRCDCKAYHFARGKPGTILKTCKHIKIARNQ
jgi:hypothetical protein